jgi:transcriptional regulator with XRE-family HTH domain
MGANGRLGLQVGRCAEAGNPTPPRSQLRRLRYRHVEAEGPSKALDDDFFQQHHLINATLYATHSSMKGRPPRSSDPTFAARLSDRLSQGDLSLRSLAEKAGVAPSTVSRALSAQAFTPLLRDKLSIALGSKPTTGRSELLLRKALRLMELERMISARSEAALRSALDYLGPEH